MLMIQSANQATQPAVFLVGPRYRHHSSHSGYEGFRRHIGTHLDPPVEERWPKRSPWGLRAESLLAMLTKTLYTFPILRIETAASLHMTRRRGAVYHVLYGDTDVWILGQIGLWTRNAVVATFHDGAEVLRDLNIGERLLRQLSAVICLAESQREYFARFLPPERIFVVPHGVDTEFFSPDVRRTTDRVCVTAGAHMRDFTTLAKAIRLVWDKDPTVRFVAISTDIGNKSAPLEVDGVEFRAGLSDQELLQAYRSATLAVYSFEWAVANNSVLESMACGLPIVATDVGGVREYVGDAAGILCPPRDPSALAAAMLRILEQSDVAIEMGRAARRRALGYDYRSVARQLSQVYDAASRLADGRAQR
jgi:glycosyltransferase involved in cell wall biosynthesis